MTTLRMTTPWRDPRTGKWMLRKRIPVRLVKASGRSGGTVKISTGTADRREALKRWPTVLRRYAAMEVVWEQKAKGVGPVQPTGVISQQAAAALAGQWFEAQVSEHSANPGEPERWEIEQAVLDGAISWSDREIPGDRTVATPGKAELAEARWLLETNHFPVTDASAVLVGGELVQAKWNFAVSMEKRAGGDWTPVAPPTPYPPLPPTALVTAPGSAPTASMMDLVEAWAMVATVKPSVVSETRYAARLLVTFLDHGDAARITEDDMRRWRSEFKKTGGREGTGGSNNTWNNRVSMLSQVFKRAVADGRLKTNPAGPQMKLPKAPNASPLPFTNEDARRILMAARNETRPSIRWAHWVMAFSGMRVSEVLQLTRSDIQQDGSIWFISVNEDGEGKSVKTRERRNVPVHPALVAEGFVTFALKVTDPNAPLFPDKRIDANGKRGGRAWQITGRWVRETVGITDKNKAPDHSWRHRIEDELRNAEVPEDSRDAITGHARKTTGAKYGTRGEALRRLHRDLSKVSADFLLEAPAV